MRHNEQVKPVTGTVRWLKPLIVGKTLGRLSITNANGKTEEYDIHAFIDGDGVVQGYGLAKDDDEIHSIDVTAGFGWTCDCPDHQFRNRECKHIKAVRAALAKCGQMPAAPQRQQPTPKAEKTSPQQQPATSVHHCTLCGNYPVEKGEDLCRDCLYPF
jgi:hypothetical protein